MMTQELWTHVDRYIEELILPTDDTLSATLRACNAADLPPYHVSAALGSLLMLLARMNKAKSILEIGTLGGYSAICLARALPKNGRLITLECVPKHADVARANIDRAGLAAIVDVRLGPALDLLPIIAAESHPSFDLTFIDADKQNNAAYFQWALKMSHPGSVIIVDNVVRNGAVADATSSDLSVQGAREVLAVMAADPRVTSTVIQTVGCKGHDGFAIAIVN